MHYLRFSPEDYRALCRLCSPEVTPALDLPAFRQLLLCSLSDTHPALAARVAALDGHQLGMLHDHFAGRAPAGRPEAPGQRLGPKEVRVLREACRCYPATVRFLRPFQANLVNVLREAFPALARKLSRMSDEQFRLLHEQITRRKRDSA
jgi:hypothetical protein